MFNRPQSSNLDVVGEAYLQQSRIFVNKKVGCRKSWNAVASWLSSTQSFTVSSTSLSDTGADASGMLVRIVSIQLLVLGRLYLLHSTQSLLLQFIATIFTVSGS